MSDHPVTGDIPEYRDYMGEALSDHKAGPVKKSKFMTGTLVFALLYIAGLAGAMLWRYLAPVDLVYAYFAMTTMLLTPFIGTAIFVIGFLRRYRYVLGKTIERTGLVIFALGWIAFFLLLANPLPQG